MIEQALYFAIGFLVAALAAIVMLPALARRAARLSEARSRLQAPKTEKQAIAERDLLRAQHAVESARIELRATRAEERVFALSAETGWQARRLLELEAAAASHEGALSERQAEVEQALQRAQELESSLGAREATLTETAAQRDRAEREAAEASARIAVVVRESSQERAKAEVLAARAEQLERRLEASDAAKARAEAALAEETRKAARLEARLAEAADLPRKIEELEQRLAMSDEARRDALIAMSRQLATIANRDAELSAAQARVKDLEMAIEAQARKMAAPETLASAADERPLGAITLMEPALNATRKEREAFTRGSVEAEGDAALRAAIGQLGREVARLWADRGEGSAASEADDLPLFGSWADVAPETAASDGAPRAAQRHRISTEPTEDGTHAGAK